MNWNFCTRKSTFIEAIEDLGDEYMNHIFRLCEDTLMMFELSQIANSFIIMILQDIDIIYLVQDKE